MADDDEEEDDDGDVDDETDTNDDDDDLGTEMIDDRDSPDEVSLLDWLGRFLFLITKHMNMVL